MLQERWTLRPCPLALHVALAWQLGLNTLPFAITSLLLAVAPRGGAFGYYA